jgi:hypothetical protein
MSAWLMMQMMQQNHAAWRPTSSRPASSYGPTTRPAAHGVGPSALVIVLLTILVVTASFLLLLSMPTKNPTLF